MSLENKLGLTSSADLAREEERISKKKALELFEKGMLDQLEAGKFSALKAIHKFFACLACFLPNFPSPLWSHIPEDDAFVYMIKWNHLRFATRTFEWIYMESPYIMALHADPTISKTIEEWLDLFEMFSIYEILPEILEMWGSNLFTDAKARKN